MVHLKNKGARAMWIPLHDIQEIHKTHDNIIGTRHGNLLEQVSIKNEISNDFIPDSIILESPGLDYNKLNIRFWAYAHVYMGTTNNKKQRTLVETALQPASEMGVYYFMSLPTDGQLH